MHPNRRRPNQKRKNPNISHSPTNRTLPIPKTSAVQLLNAVFKHDSQSLRAEEAQRAGLQTGLAPPKSAKDVRYARCGEIKKDFKVAGDESDVRDAQDSVGDEISWSFDVEL